MSQAMKSLSKKGKRKKSDPSRKKSARKKAVKAVKKYTRGRRSGYSVLSVRCHTHVAIAKYSALEQKSERVKPGKFSENKATKKKIFKAPCDAQIEIP